MPSYLTSVTVTSGGRKLAPGRHDFSKEVGDKLVARGFAKEVAEPVQAELPVQPAAPAGATSAPAVAATKGKSKAKAVKGAEKAESEAQQGEAQAEASEPGDDA